MKRIKFCQKVWVLALVLVFSISSVIVTHSTALAALVINEIMVNPSLLGDLDAEWFEILNPSGTDVDINGWTIRDLGSNTHIINNVDPLNVPAGGYLVLGYNGDTSENGGVDLDYVYSGIQLANSADELELFDGDEVVDQVAWGSGWPITNGASMELLISALDDNHLSSNWYAATTPWSGGDGDYGSPGAVNGPVPIPGAVWLLGSGLIGLGVFRRKFKT